MFQFRSHCHGNTYLELSITAKIGQTLLFRKVQPHFHFSLSNICHAHSTARHYSTGRCSCGLSKNILIMDEIFKNCIHHDFDLTKNSESATTIDPYWQKIIINGVSDKNPGNFENHLTSVLQLHEI